MTQAAILAASGSPGTTTGFKNKLINGNMVIDQRNAGATVTPTSGGFGLDRWKFYLTQASKLTVGQSTTAPAGFNNSMLITSSSAYSVPSGDLYIVQQPIEGYNAADLGWGTADAKTVTLSFWVRSSLTGTFGGAINNGTLNYSYPFSYTISSANTWTQISVTIAGPTAGTWVGATNAASVCVTFSLGVGTTSSGTAGSWSANSYYSTTGAVSVVGTSGATWYMTGCQLEVGTTATNFDFRSIGQELFFCQRYYETSFPITTAPAQNLNGVATNGTAILSTYTYFNGVFMASKRAQPTITLYAGNNVGSPTSGQVQYYQSGIWQSSTASAAGGAGYSTFNGNFQPGSGSFNVGNSVLCSYNWAASAEL